NFGDSDYRTMLLEPPESLERWSTDEMHYVVTGGKAGHRQRSAWKEMSEGGYFVVRNPSTSLPDNPHKDNNLTQSTAFHSRTHKHADHLTFLWHDRGSDLIVDAGRYGYIGKTDQGTDLWLKGNWYSDPMRIYCESTRAHNTLEFNGIDYPRRKAK